MDHTSDSLPTRHTLLNRIKDLGDNGSWREFFETYWELIYNLAHKAGLNEMEAQEVVQETVIGVSRKIGSFKIGSEHGSFKAWLLQQTRWRIADQFRKRGRFSPVGEFPSESLGLPADQQDETATGILNRVPDPKISALDQLWDEEWQKHLLRAGVERVRAQASHRQFQMFDLHVLQGLSVAETARTTGATLPATYMAISRVRRLLSREMKLLTTGAPLR